MTSPKLILVLMAVGFSLFSFTLAETKSELMPTANATVRTRYEESNFWQTFEEGNEEFMKRYWFSGYWGNGQPFNVGWDPSYWKINQYNVLELALKKVDYFWQDKYWPWTAGELKSRDFYGSGT